MRYLKTFVSILTMVLIVGFAVIIIIPAKETEPVVSEVVINHTVDEKTVTEVTTKETPVTKSNISHDEIIEKKITQKTVADAIDKVVEESKEEKSESVAMDYIETTEMPRVDEITTRSTPNSYTYASTSLSDADIDALVKTLYGEANSVEDEAERSMVIWTILNRLDNGGYGNTVEEICTASGQFTGYSYSHPVTDENLELVYDVIDRWGREKAGEEDVGRTLPEEYCYFVADSNPAAGEWHNAFYAFSGGNQGEKIWYDYENPNSNPYAN